MAKFKVKIVKLIVKFFIELVAGKTDYIMGDNFQSKYTFAIFQTVSLNLWCTMDFSLYPLDKQVCEYEAYMY